MSDSFFFLFSCPFLSKGVCNSHHVHGVLGKEVVSPLWIFQESIFGFEFLWSKMLYLVVPRKRRRVRKFFCAKRLKLLKILPRQNASVVIYFLDLRFQTVFRSHYFNLQIRWKWVAPPTCLACVFPQICVSVSIARHFICCDSCEPKYSIRAGSLWVVIHFFEEELERQVLIELKCRS